MPCFIPIRFIFTTKLGKDDKLLLAFDALALGKILGREISLGKIVHGDDHVTLKVKTSALAGEVRKRAEKITVLLSNPEPPDLVLNRHCAECEYQARCRKIAAEKDDLSLLAGMNAKERQKLCSKGIFTVTQLSYTFRPRRRPKRMRDKREKYHHSLKALAIRNDLSVTGNRSSLFWKEMASRGITTPLNGHFDIWLFNEKYPAHFQVKVLKTTSAS